MSVKSCGTDRTGRSHQSEREVQQTLSGTQSAEEVRERLISLADSGVLEITGTNEAGELLFRFTDQGEELFCPECDAMADYAVDLGIAPPRWHCPNCDNRWKKTADFGLEPQ